MRRTADRFTLNSLESSISRSCTRCEYGFPVSSQLCMQADYFLLCDPISTTPERQLQKLVVEYEKFQRERLPVCTKETGHLVETSCTIMDLKNVGISQFWKVNTRLSFSVEIWKLVLMLLFRSLRMCSKRVTLASITIPRQWVSFRP